MTSIQKSQWLRTLVLASLALMLFACSGQQVKEPELPTCPELELPDLDRQKPLAAMGGAIPWPEVPQGFELWSGEQQARWIVENWARGAEAYSLCEGKRTGLIDWINE